MADEDPENPEELQESDHELSQIPDTPSVTTNATKSPSKMSKLQSLVSTIMQNGSPSASHASTIMVQTPSASQASTIAAHTPSATSKTIPQRDPSVSKETLKSQERTKKSQELSLSGKRTSLDRLSKEESDVDRKPRMHRRCQRRFRELIGKRELKKEELTKQQCVLKERLDVLECSMPAVMVWNIWRMSQGTCVPNLKQVMEKQFQGPASGEVYCPSTPSRHFDCRVREVEAERKLAQKRADEARTLWAEKEAALEEKSKKLEEAKKTQIQIKENIEKLKVEAQKLREASKTADDEACESGECRVIECKKKWLEKVPSGASIKSTDIECLEELQHLAQTELCMKRQIAELERREEAYMRTLQQADELWCKLQGDASSVTTALQDQLDVKTSANQRMADRIVQLEDAAEELRARLATCRGQLEKFMSIDKIEALIGRDDDFADVLDKGIDVETLMSSKYTLVKPEAGEAGSQIGPDLADLATGVYYADLISMEDAGLGIRPEDFAHEKQKIDEAREYLSAYRTLSELFTDDDYVCPNDFPCNDVVLTETGLTQEEMTALNEGRVTAETLLNEMQLEDQPVAMTRMVRHMEQTFEETILEDGTVVADVMRYDDQITTESFGTIDEREILVGEVKTEIESVKDYVSVVEGKIVEQTIIQTEPASYTSVQATPDNILVPFNELETWQDNVDTIRETLAKCPDCVVVKEGADAMAETMAKYTGRGAKEVIDELTIKRESADEIPEPEMIAEGIEEETMVVEEVAVTEEVKYVEDFGEEMPQERIEIETATLSVTQEASEAAMPEVIPSFVEDEVSHLTEDLPPDEVATSPFIEMESPVAEKEDYEEPRRPDEELITADAASAIAEEKSRTVVAEEIETVTISESTEVARGPREETRRTETEEVEVLVEKTVEVKSISPDEEKVAEALSTKGRDEPDVVAEEMIMEQEVPKTTEEEAKSQIVPGKREESKPQVVAEKKDEEAVVEPVPGKEKEVILEVVPEEGEEVVLEVVPEKEKEVVLEVVPEGEEEIVLEPVPEGEEVVLELVPEEVEETVLELVPGEVEEPVLEVVPEEAEEAVLEVPEREEETVLEPVPEEEEEAVSEPVPEEKEKLAEEEEAVTELPAEAAEEEIEVEMLPEVEEAEPEPTEEREIEVEVPTDEVEETILPVDVLPEEEEAEIEEVPVVEEEEAVPMEEVPEVEILLAPLPEEVEGVPIEARIVSEVEVTIQVHVEEIRVLETPMSRITVMEEATPPPCICALPPEESEESDVSEVPEVLETPVPVTVYGVSYIHISASQRTILEIPKVPAPEKTQEVPCICCTMYQKEPVTEPPKSPDTEEVCELPCTCYLTPEEPVPEPRKTEDTEEMYGPPCTCFMEPEKPDTRSRAPVLEKIQEAPCICRSISEEPVIKTPKAPLEKRIREDPFDFSFKPEESVSKRSKTTIPEDPREVLSARFTKPDISDVPEPEEIDKHPCVCSVSSEASEIPEFPYVEGSVFLPFMYSIPNDEPEPTTKMEITQTEVIRNFEAMQVITQTVSDAGTQTPLSKFVGPSPQPTRITMTRPVDPDADITSQISRKRRPATMMMMMTATASTQTEKSSFLQVTQTDAKRTPSRRISDILRSLRAEVIHRRSDPEEELKSIDYSKKQPGTCKPVGKCNCCVCGKEMTESRAGSGRQSSTVFRILPPVSATKVDPVPGVDQGVQQDAMCPRCKISKLHESLKSQESLKRSRKEPSRSTCDKEVCASLTSKSSASSRQKRKIDQSVTAKIPKSRPKAEKPTQKDSEKTVQEIMTATKPVDKKSSHCICEMENGEPGSTSEMKCACGDPD